MVRRAAHKQTLNQDENTGGSTKLISNDKLANCCGYWLLLLLIFVGESPHFRGKRFMHIK